MKPREYWHGFGNGFGDGGQPQSRVRGRAQPRQQPRRRQLRHKLKVDHCARSSHGNPAARCSHPRHPHLPICAALARYHTCAVVACAARIPARRTRTGYHDATHRASSGFRRDLLNGSLQTMWNRDAPEPLDENVCSFNSAQCLMLQFMLSGYDTHAVISNIAGFHLRTVSGLTVSSSPGVCHSLHHATRSHPYTLFWNKSFIYSQMPWIRGPRHSCSTHCFIISTSQLARSSIPRMCCIHSPSPLSLSMPLLILSPSPRKCTGFGVFHHSSSSFGWPQLS